MLHMDSYQWKGTKTFTSNLHNSYWTLHHMHHVAPFDSLPIQVKKTWISYVLVTHMSSGSTSREHLVIQHIVKSVTELIWTCTNQAYCGTNFMKGSNVQCKEMKHHLTNIGYGLSWCTQSRSHEFMTTLDVGNRLYMHSFYCYCVGQVCQVLCQYLLSKQHHVHLTTVLHYRSSAYRHYWQCIPNSMQIYR